MSDPQFDSHRRDKASVVHSMSPLKRVRGKSSWPFGPVGIRGERRKPFRANEFSLSASRTDHPLRRADD